MSTPILEVPDYTAADAFLRHWTSSACLSTQNASSQTQRGSAFHSPLAARASADATAFLNGYPNAPAAESIIDNIEFFLGKRRMNGPGGLLRSELLQLRGNDNEYLESAHDFIQWLFPIREQGMNPDASPLQPHEVAVIRAYPHVFQPLIREHYEVMLRFYGLRLVDSTTGAVGRAPDWPQRYSHLLHHPHNNLRITRMLKCLAEFGLPHYQAPFVWHFVRERGIAALRSRVDNGAVNGSGSKRTGALEAQLGSSVRHFWQSVVVDGSARTTLAEVADAFAAAKAADAAGATGPAGPLKSYLVEDKTLSRKLSKGSRASSMSASQDSTGDNGARATVPNRAGTDLLHEVKEDALPQPPKDTPTSAKKSAPACASHARLSEGAAAALLSAPFTALVSHGHGVWGVQPPQKTPTGAAPRATPGRATGTDPTVLGATAASSWDVPAEMVADVLAQARKAMREKKTAPAAGK